MLAEGTPIEDVLDIAAIRQLDNEMEQEKEKQINDAFRR